MMLMPAAVLIFIVLGAICVDVAVVFLAQRELANAAAAAANDAATRALDLDEFYAEGTISVVPAEAERVAATSVAAKRLDYIDIAPPVVTVDGVGQVTVLLTAEVGYIFAKAIPRGPTSTSVSATAVATARTR
jgi:Flp pilus assembly protein TadG